jgi:hypothetical protein
MRDRILADLNPLRLEGKSIPPNLVLIGRFIGLTLLLLRDTPFPRHLPYLELLDALGSEGQFHAALRLAAGLGYALLFFGPFIRSGCFLLGSAMLVGLLACRPCQSVAHTYVACLFLVISMSGHATGPWLARMQVVMLYAGATIHKVLDPDWWNGRYFETLMIARHQHSLYSYAAAQLPPLSLSTSMGVVTILTEAAIVACLLRRRWYVPGVLLGVFFHSVMVLLMGQTFGPFYAAIMVSYVAFLSWPERLELSPGRFVSASWSKRLLAAIDPDRLWTVRESASFAVTAGDRRYSGLSAVRKMVVASPLACMGFAAAISIRTSWHVRDAAIVVLLLLTCTFVAEHARRLIRSGIAFRR